MKADARLSLTSTFIGHFTYDEERLVFLKQVSLASAFVGAEYFTPDDEEGLVDS